MKSLISCDCFLKNPLAFTASFPVSSGIQPIAPNPFCLPVPVPDDDPDDPSFTTYTTSHYFD